MNEQEFGEAVQDVFARAIASGKTKAQAHTIAEKFRSDLIKTLAKQAWAKMEGHYDER